MSSIADTLMTEGAQKLDEQREQIQRLIEALGVCLEALHTAKHGGAQFCDDEMEEMVDSAIAVAREARKGHGL